jgi:tetratricopeptide (TPR) repeat protein
MLPISTLSPDHEMATIADGEKPNTPANKLLWARIKLARRDLGGALKALLETEAMNPELPGIYIQIGDTYARLLQWQNARVAYEKAIALDDDNARGFLGLSTVYRKLGDNQQTVDHALRAVLQRCRPDWDISGAEQRAAWAKGDKAGFYPYGRTQAQRLADED